jgi:hypothetical protein
MKHTVASLTVGACLLLSLGAAAFATNAHNVSGTPGRNGTNGSGVAACGGTQASPPGQAGNNSVSSPFNSVKVYAGSGAGKSDTAGGAPASQYDNACFQHQMP